MTEKIYGRDNRTEDFVMTVDGKKRKIRHGDETAIFCTECSHNRGPFYQATQPRRSHDGMKTVYTCPVCGWYVEVFDTEVWEKLRENHAKRRRESGLFEELEVPRDRDGLPAESKRDGDGLPRD